MSMRTESTAQPVRPPTSEPHRDFMRAAQIGQPRQIQIVETPLPIPARNELLVKVEGCGVCGSNLPLWEGREWFTYPLPPGNPGHEAWGEVVTLDAENRQGLAIGDRVAMLSYNAFAEYDVAAADAVVKLPASLAGRPFPAEPLACAFNVFARSNIRPGEIVAIIGIGFLGAILTALAVKVGAEVIAISRRGFALDIARDYGAAHTIPMHDHWQIIEEVKELTGDAGCACVIEAVGQQWPLDLAAELTRIRGRLIIAGYHQDGLRQVNMQLWNWRGLDVINAHERDPALYVDGMNQAVAAVAGGRLDPTPLYTHFYPLDQLDEALTVMAERPDGFLKALITFT
ncbi:MAG: zinc-binding dehydrogenase [Caldilineaceae bacterium]